MTRPSPAVRALLPAALAAAMLVAPARAQTSTDGAVPNSSVPNASEAAPAPPDAETVEGRPRVLDTGRIVINRRTIELQGVEGLGGKFAEDLRLFIDEQGGVLTCRPVDPPKYRCSTRSNVDLSSAVLFNGGGKASSDAPPELKAHEERAKSRRVGVWASS